MNDGKVITMVLFNRPAYTREVLEAWRKCHGIQNYSMRIHIEPGCDEVIELARSIDFCERTMYINRERLGIGINTKMTLEDGFEHSDFIIHCEDDTVPAPDLLAYMEHCRYMYKFDQEVFSVASYNRDPKQDDKLYAVARRRYFTCWLYGLWRDRWASGLRYNWSRDIKAYATHTKNWMQSRNMVEIYPLLGRSQNIGAEGGVHVPSAEWHRENHYTEEWAGKYDIKPVMLYPEVNSSIFA
jgi:hypothetical protein